MRGRTPVEITPWPGFALSGAKGRRAVALQHGSRDGVPPIRSRPGSYSRACNGLLYSASSPTGRATCCSASWEHAPLAALGQVRVCVRVCVRVFLWGRISPQTQKSRAGIPANLPTNGYERIPQVVVFAIHVRSFYRAAKRGQRGSHAGEPPVPSSKPKRLASAQVRRCGKLLYRVGVFLCPLPQERQLCLQFKTGGDYRTSRFRLLVGSGCFAELLRAMLAVNRTATMGAILSAAGRRAASNAQ